MLLSLKNKKIKNENKSKKQSNKKHKNNKQNKQKQQQHIIAPVYITGGDTIRQLL